MHVVILNQTFHPDVAATGQLMWDLSRHLRASGHRVSAITSRGFYGEEHRHPQAFERIEGIDIHRISATSLGKRSLVHRLSDFASFYAGAAIHLQRLSAPDVVFALTSPPLVASLAMLQRQFSQRRVRFVYHIMDLYPDAAMAMDVVDPSSQIGRTLRRITCRTLDTADAVIALGRDMKQRLLAVYHRHAKPDQICVVPPWADGRELFPLQKSAADLAKTHGLTDTFNIVYSGNLGMAHDVETIIAAIDASRHDPSMRWIFIGGGKRSEYLQREAQTRRWENIRFLPFQDRQRLNDSLNIADVHLISQLPAFSGIVVPSKLAGIMAVARPAVMVGPADAECSRILSENAAGFVVANNDPGLLLTRLQTLRDNRQLASEMGARARAAFEKHYSRPVACSRIEAVLRCVVDPTSGIVPAGC